MLSLSQSLLPTASCYCNAEIDIDATEKDMAKREHSGYTPYVNYGAYYTTYTPYPAAAEEEATKVRTPLLTSILCPNHGP